MVRGCIKFSNGLKRFRRQPVTSKMAVKIDSLLRVLHGRWSIYGWPSSREKSGDTASFQGPFCCHYPRFILNSYSSEFQDPFETLDGWHIGCRRIYSRDNLQNSEDSYEPIILVLTSRIVIMTQHYRSFTGNLLTHRPVTYPRTPCHLSLLSW